MKATSFEVRVFANGEAYLVEGVTTRDINDFNVLIPRMLLERTMYCDGVKITRVTESTCGQESILLWAVDVDIWTPIEDVTAEMVERTQQTDWIVQKAHPSFDAELLQTYVEDKRVSAHEHLKVSMQENPAFTLYSSNTYCIRKL